MVGASPQPPLGHRGVLGPNPRGGAFLFIHIDLPDQAVLVALISGCTTVAVAVIHAAARVAVAWIERPKPDLPPSSPREIEPPGPDP
jgi:hypothetical protein